MILLLSKRNDGSTNRIIDWLSSWGKDFLRINGDDNNTQFITISEEKIIVSQDGKLWNLLESDSLWFRRRAFSSKSFNYKNSEENLKSIFFNDDKYINKRIKEEFNTVIEYIYNRIESSSKKIISSYFTSDLNKLIVLKIAKNIGLKTPDSNIVMSKQSLKKILDKDGVITKACKEGVYLINKEYGYYSYTERILQRDIEKFSEFFVPSLLQSEINKKYELRVFFINGKFYSTVIFSQSRKTTNIDHRRYSEIPARNLPYKLPIVIENLLHKLMDILGLNIGAIDLIVDDNDNYIFLEVNPIGQFSFYSDKCNYYVEKDLAKILT